MKATILEVADAVVAELNAQQFSQPFTAQRLYRPDLRLADMTTLHVSVVPRGLKIEPLCRGADMHQYQIDIGVQQRFAAEAPADLDPLMRLVEEIADHFRAPRMGTLPAAACVGVENDPIYAPDHIDQLRQFTSVIRLTFRLPR